MAGLMDMTEPGTAPAGEAPPSPTQVDQGGEPMDSERVGDDEDQREQASPEEQEQYEAFVKSGYALIYEGGEVRKGILDLLDEDPSDLIEVLGDNEQIRAGSPAVRLAATAVIVVLEVIRRDGKPADDIIMHGGQEILEDLGNLAEEAGLHDYSQDELNQAWLMANDLYRESASQDGLVDNDALKTEFEGLVTAEKEGRLGEVLPGLAKAKIREAPGDELPAEEGAV